MSSGHGPLRVCKLRLRRLTSRCANVAGRPMDRKEALAMRGAYVIGDLSAHVAPDTPRLILADTSAWAEYDRATGELADRCSVLTSDGDARIPRAIIVLR